MKKEYVMPAIKVVELKMESLMTTTSGELDSTGVGGGSAGDETGDYANGHRGTWGNFWD